MGRISKAGLGAFTGAAALALSLAAIAQAQQAPAPAQQAAAPTVAFGVGLEEDPEGIKPETFFFSLAAGPSAGHRPSANIFRA
jgi:ABC-type transport system substrate-binding protein